MRNGAWIGAAVWRALLAVGLVACGGEGRRSPADSAGSGAAAREPNVLVRLAAASDSAARALGDSLSREGWLASARRAAPPAAGSVVDIAVSGDTTLARALVHALRIEGTTTTVVVAGTRAPSDVGVTLVPVNRGAHGMSARIRWAAGAGRRALLVVEDPRGAENDPVPNAFVIAIEGVPAVQRDSVWDVVPAPDWGRVAYARAYTTAPGESDSVPPSEWHRLAASVGLLESLVRRHAFPTSGMSTAYGAARPFIIDSITTGSADPSRDRALPIAEGWRLGWSADGTRLAIGAPPELITDDGMSPTWRLVDPATGSPRGRTTTASVVRPQWTEGPTLDISTPIDMKTRRAFRTGGGDVESEDGWIRVFSPEARRLREPRIVGPGVALATTANGAFIVAIAPDPGARSYDPPNRLVVYHVIRR